MYKKLAAIILTLAIGVVGALAQGGQGGQMRSTVPGQKYKIKGTIVSRDDNGTLVVRDMVGVDTKVVVAPNASIKNNRSGLFGGSDSYPASALIRSLVVEVEGTGDNGGAISANKIRFDKSDLKTAQVVEARTVPLDERMSAAEQNAQRVSGQIDELMAISNAAKGGAKAAQETADAAVAGVNATNKRITDMDDFVTFSTATVNFKVNSAALSADAKASLEQIAASTKTLKGYLIDITGYASAEGGTARNKRLSQLRAQAVKDYLVENFDLDRRRFNENFGFGELKAVADNSTRSGREQNRRVEIKVLVNKGINQSVEVKPNPND